MIVICFFISIFYPFMEGSIKGQKKFDESEFKLYRVQFKLAFNAQQTLYNNNMPSDHTTFEATFPQNGTISSRNMGRIIGVAGCGTKRLVSAVKATYATCRPFVRGDRTAGTFKLSAKGPDGENAIRFLADALQKELDWVSGQSDDCPHAHQWVDASNWTVDMKHIIGSRGVGIKNIQEKGGFILHKERNGANWFLVEGIDNMMVQRMVLKLNERKQTVERAQRSGPPRRVQVDLSRPANQTTGGDTNSFGSLQDSSDESDSSDEEIRCSSPGSDDDEELLKGVAASQKAAEDDIRRHLQSSQLRGRGSGRSLAAEMHAVRCELAGKRGVEPFQVSDRDVNEFLRQMADDEDFEQARRQNPSLSVDTRSEEHFPDTLSKGDGEANMKLEVRSLGAWGGGAPKEKTITPEQLVDASDNWGHSSAPTKSWPAPPPPPRPTLARTMTTGAAAASAFNGTPPADDCWPQAASGGGWGSSDDDDSDVEEF